MKPGRSLSGGMMRAAAIVLIAAMTGCGGGGDSGTAASTSSSATNTPTPTTSTATTPVPPATPTSATVTIFVNPTPQEYASIGVSTSSAGDGYQPVEKDSRLTSVLFDAANQARIRSRNAGYYEVLLPGADWDRLVYYKGSGNPTSDDNFFQPAGSAQNYATFIISRSRFDGYRYSEVASWTKGDVSPGLTGYLAFGEATPSAAIPVAGTVIFNGSISVMVDKTYFDGLYGGYYFDSLDGQLSLTVDFGARTIVGTLTLTLDLYATPKVTATYSIAPIALGVGVNGRSGSIESSQSGYNDFRALFTGPAAEELIGALALPLTIDGRPHQAMGAWIVKRASAN